MLPLDAFSPDYKTARARFRDLLAERGGSHEAHEVLATGFAPSELTIDVGRLGAPNAERLLILSCGLHGGEGFFGSAAQLAWFDSLPSSWRPPAGCAVLLLHALNPYGFACVRRANEHNVDLNRNFLSGDDFDCLREQTARDFGPLDPYLNPARPPGRFNWFPVIFPWMALRFGLPVLRKVMPAGQYAFPKGIFFGGAELARTPQILAAEMPRWLGPARFVLHLDFHTGLGRFATHKLLASGPLAAERMVVLRRFFGQDRVRFDHETDDGYHNFGDMGEWLTRRFAANNYVYFCAEFGTYNSTRVIGALRRENQANYWGRPDSAVYRKCKAEALEVFAPRSAWWKKSVIRQSIRLIQSSLMFCAGQQAIAPEIG
jgi:hypothetical protein